ncbi:MAG: hypothetical protein Q8P44_01005 [Dehalococcoidia bacterium]|nr:hypothetical protein [Dehalococcoidia bacterium]
MPLPVNWASAEDFATLFQYFWHRDFPIDEISTGAKRTDWTIHIGVIVRSIADLMGLVTRFERRGRKDAVLSCAEGDELAIEWEWGGVWGNELDKLKVHNAWSAVKGKEKLLKYAVLITYTHTPNIDKVYQHVTEKWKDARYPLLLVLVDVKKSKRFTVGKEFKHIQMSLFNSTGRTDLRVAPAFPWNVESSRWSYLKVNNMK